MRTVNQVVLRASWKAYYDSFSKKLVGDDELDAKSKAFNVMLKERMTKAQKSGEKLIAEDVYQICSSITRRVYDLGILGITSMDLKAISQAMQGANFVTMLSCVDTQGKDYDFVHVHCLGHIPLDGLTDSEISVLLNCFGGDVSEQWNTLIVLVLERKMNSLEWYKKNFERIERMAKNASFSKLDASIREKYSVGLGFHYSLIDRIKDHLVLRKI